MCILFSIHFVSNITHTPSVLNINVNTAALFTPQCKGSCISKFQRHNLAATMKRVDTNNHDAAPM
jgi:hypothetical protein